MFVERVRYCSEALLPCRVPNLHIHLILSRCWCEFSFNVIQPNRRNVVLIEYALSVPI